MRTVVFRANFELDFLAATKWYNEERLGLGDEFAEELERCIQRIIRQPESFPLMDEVVRVCRLRKFPYGIYFRVTRHEIIVASVIHLHRDDSAWKSRT